MNKDELRKKYLIIRKNIQNKKEKSDKIFNLLINNKLFINSNIIGIYYSLIDEVSTKRLIDYSKRIGKTILLPRVNNLDLEFISIDENTIYKKSNLGIIEPINGKIYDGSNIDLLIIPGIAFDKYCNRIGFGKGYYDRYLNKYKISNIAICFEDQITNEIIKSDKYDIKVDMIQTETTTYHKK